MADDLTCTEEYASEISSSVIEKDVARALNREDTKSLSHLNLYDVLHLQLTKEQAGEYLPRNARYIEEVQVHDMDTSWRRRICHWMFETGKAFELAMETVGCAIYFMDQYLSKYSVDKIMLQLLSLVCMETASKMHERHPISMEEMKTISQNKFSAHDIARLELQLLLLVQWKLSPPCSITFALTLLQGMDISLEEREGLSEEVCSLLRVVIEHYESIQYKSSLLGFGAVHVVWNGMRCKSFAALQETYRAFDIATSEEDFIACYRFVLQIQLRHAEPTQFVSVEESDNEPSRSISPIGVEASATSIWQLSPHGMISDVLQAPPRGHSTRPLKKHRCE